MSATGPTGPTGPTGHRHRDAMAPTDPAQLGFGFSEPRRPTATHGPRRIVRVRPDVVGLDRLFDYTVPDDLDVQIGDVVRIDLGARRERGWITAIDVDTDDHLELRPLDRRSGRGPTLELIDLADWAAWRWAGRPVHLLRAATPPAMVTDLPAPAPRPERPAEVEPWIDHALGQALGVVTCAPGEDRYPLIRAAAATDRGHALILCPTIAEATALAGRLERDGVRTALLAGQDPATTLARHWARARAGHTVVGTRMAAWAPLPKLGRVIVLDEHDEAYQGDRSPTWHARDVVIERARRADRPCLLVSPTPSLEARMRAVRISRDPATVRRGWPPVEIVDKRQLDPAHGPLFSPRVVDLVRGSERVLLILDRTGRVRLLVCGHCGDIARCEVCEGAVALEAGVDGDEFVCSRDDHRRPPICLTCSATRFKHLRLGVSRAREELEVLARQPVGEVTASTGPIPKTPILIGTEALLRRAGTADHVVFLDFDQHLLATRHRGGQDALALLALAGRLVTRRGRGRIVVQTRDPEHPVLDAAVRGDPDRFAEPDLDLHRRLGLPPVTAMALVTGAGAEEFMNSFGTHEGVQIQGPIDGVHLLRADDHRILCDALAATPRPGERLRIEVDPRSM